MRWKAGKDMHSHQGFAVVAEQLTKVFPTRNGKDIVSVDHLDLQVPSGQVFGFLGANGAGKTTTLKMACGLVTPSSGKVWIDGMLQGKHRRKIMPRIGVVLEGTRNVYWRLSAWENILYFGRLKGLWGRPLKRRATELLQGLALWERRHQVVRQFSRGMQQKVAIACAMIADPKIILLDEPTLGLDVHTTRTIKQWVTDLAGEQGKTVILTTHQMRMAQEVCQSVGIIRNGKLIAHQPVKELLSLFNVDHFTIRVKGKVQDADREKLNGFKIEPGDDETRISGTMPQQDVLYETLARLRQMGFPLLGVMKTEPDLEEAFVRMTGGPQYLLGGANG